MKEDEDRIVGAMLALACGDALGAPAEFLQRETLQSRYGRLTEMVGNTLWEPGEWTDDTAMALCVAEGILASPQNPVLEIGERFRTWKSSGPKDIGNTISDALGQYLILRSRSGPDQNNWPKASQSTAAAKQGKAAGNGSLMRTLPVALAYPNTKKMLRESARISAMTHWDAQAEVCCAVYGFWIHRLLNGESRPDAWLSAVQDAREAADQENLAPGETPGPAPLPSYLWSRLENAPFLPETSLQPTGYAGYVLDCLEAAVWWVLNSDSLENTLIGCVNMAGEADTIAAVAGGAAGAFWGQSAIPQRWQEQLLDRERIEKAGLELAKMRGEDETPEQT